MRGDVLSREKRGNQQSSEELANNDDSGSRPTGKVKEPT